ncbi:MAG: hypothetical protein ACLTUW_07030 [Lachnospira eligens]
MWRSFFAGSKPAIQNVLAQILDYMANADNEQRSTKCGSCELSRLGSSEAA